jgi:hypothetical protein
VDPKDDTLTAKANAAFRQAARKVIERARQTGTLIYVWENGKVVGRTCDEMEQAVGRETTEKPAQPSSANEGEEAL